MQQYVDRLSGEHARRNSVSAFAAEVFMNNAGSGHSGQEEVGVRMSATPSRFMHVTSLTARQRRQTKGVGGGGPEGDHGVM